MQRKLHCFRDIHKSSFFHYSQILGKVGGPLDTLSGVEQNSEGLVECRKPIEDQSYGCAGIDQNVFFKHLPKFWGAIVPDP